MPQKTPLGSIDLSGLPELLRKKVQEQLDRMSPEMQQEFLKKSKPMLDRAMDKAQGGENTGAEALRQLNRLKPQGHYNQTIQPGDGHSMGFLKIMLLLVVLVVAYQFF